jgi:CHAD domain-containing protein
MASGKCRSVPLCAYADPLVRDLRRLVPLALRRGDPDAIHDARVATRRLRAALDLLEPMLGEVKPLAMLRKTLRRLRRQLGPLRDLDVMLEHLRPLRSRPRHAEAARWLGDRLEHERSLARRKAQKKNPPDKWIARLDAWETLRNAIIALDDAVARRMRSSLLSQWEAFAARADRLGRHMLDGSAATAQDPHELRIAGKQLRYTFEMLARTRTRPPAAVARTFKRMQDELGLWHDHVVLAECAMHQSIDALLAHHDPELQAQVLAMTTATLRTARHRLARFARLWREKGPGLSEIVRGLPTVEAAATLTRLETDPGLFDSAELQDSPPPPERSTAPPGETSAA